MMSSCWKKGIPKLPMSSMTGDVSWKTPRTIHEWNKFNELVGGFNSIFFIKVSKWKKYSTQCVIYIYIYLGPDERHPCINGWLSIGWWTKPLHRKWLRITISIAIHFKYAGGLCNSSRCHPHNWIASCNLLGHHFISCTPPPFFQFLSRESLHATCTIWTLHVLPVKPVKRPAKSSTWKGSTRNQQFVRGWSADTNEVD